MARIENEAQYNAIMERIEELLLIVDDDTPLNDKNSVELVLLSEMIIDHDEALYPPKRPSIADILKLRMYERSITQKDLGEILGVSPSRISEYMTGKSEPTLQVARTMVKELDISPGVILGVC